MKFDTLVTLIKDLRTNAITDDIDPANILIPLYASPYDQMSNDESVRVFNNTTTRVWGDGTTYTAYDQAGNPYQAPSCGWVWGAGGRWGGTSYMLTLFPVIYEKGM